MNKVQSLNQNENAAKSSGTAKEGTPQSMTQTNFLSQHFDPNRNRIFLIGSSQIMPLNTTYIQQELSKNNENFDVYSLGLGGDTPQQRATSLELLISAKPKIVVYGIAYRDFMSPLPSELSANKPSSPLPDPHDFFENLITKSNLFSNHDLRFLENPKLVTLTALKNLESSVGGKKSTGQVLESQPYPNAIFTEIVNDVPKSDIELRNTFFVEGASFNGIGNPDENTNLIALNKIITKLHENNIKVIIFTTPQSKYYLDVMPPSEKEAFDNVLQNISKENNVKIHSLTSKYADLPIWYDAQHVAVFKNIPIFSDDIAKIILEEIRS